MQSNNIIWENIVPQKKKELVEFEKIDSEEGFYEWHLKYTSYFSKELNKMIAQEEYKRFLKNKNNNIK